MGSKAMDYSRSERKTVLELVFNHFAGKMGANGFGEIFAAVRDYPASDEMSFRDRFNIMREAIESFTITDVVNRYRYMIDHRDSPASASTDPDDSPGTVAVPDEPRDSQNRESVSIEKGLSVFGRYAFSPATDIATFIITVKRLHGRPPLTTLRWEKKTLRWQVSQIRSLTQLYNFAKIQIDGTAHGDAVAQLVGEFFPLVTRTGAGASAGAGFTRTQQERTVKDVW